MPPSIISAADHSATRGSEIASASTLGSHQTQGVRDAHDRQRVELLR